MDINLLMLSLVKVYITKKYKPVRTNVITTKSSKSNIKAYIDDFIEEGEILD
jgi:hypothetical protein